MSRRVFARCAGRVPLYPAAGCAVGSGGAENFLVPAFQHNNFNDLVPQSVFETRHRLVKVDAGREISRKRG
jgi:hypothetical protein